MSLNMPGHMTRPTALEHIDRILNVLVEAELEALRTIIEDDLKTGTPQGVGLYLYLTSPDLFRRGKEISPFKTDAEYREWLDDFVIHINNHWYSDGSQRYFQTTLSRDSKIRIISRGYLEAVDIRIVDQRYKVVSYNVCEGDEFEFYVATDSAPLQILDPAPDPLPHLEVNQITCILLTGSMAKKVKLPAESDKDEHGNPIPQPVDSRKPREDVLVKEYIKVIADADAIEHSVEHFPRQGRAHGPERGNIACYTPWRIKFKLVKHPVEDAPPSPHGH